MWHPCPLPARAHSINLAGNNFPLFFSSSSLLHYSVCVFFSRATLFPSHSTLASSLSSGTTNFDCFAFSPRICPPTLPWAPLRAFLDSFIRRVFQIGGANQIGGVYHIRGANQIGGAYQIGGANQIGGVFQIGGVDRIGGVYHIGGAYLIDDGPAS